MTGANYMNYCLEKQSNTGNSGFCQATDTDETIPMQHSDTRNLSAGAELFTPEILDNCSDDINSYAFRFLGRHAGQFQCKVTYLVFEVEGETEVLYRIVSWDTYLQDGLGHILPAGPLYDIKCFQGLVTHLHLPHCEIFLGENQSDLEVVHITSDNLEILKPAVVTNSHVIITTHSLSAFGLLKQYWFRDRPISAQILLFYKEMKDKRRRKQLNIHLLPGNVPVDEVKRRHEDSVFYNTSSSCQLTPGRKYRPSCTPYVPVPRDCEFKRDYGPNYHPTFVVYFGDEDFTLSVIGEDGMEVWEPHEIVLPDQSKVVTKHKWIKDDEFLEKNISVLIQKVPNVMEIADHLLSKGMISKETYSEIRNEKTSQKQMRTLLLSLNARTIKQAVCKLLYEKYPHLVDEIESGTSKT